MIYYCSQDYIYHRWWGWRVTSGLNLPNSLKQRYAALTPEEITAMVSRVEVIAQGWWSWWYRLWNINAYAEESALVDYHKNKAGEKKTDMQAAKKEKNRSSTLEKVLSSVLKAFFKIQEKFRATSVQEKEFSQKLREEDNAGRLKEAIEEGTETVTIKEANLDSAQLLGLEVRVGMS